MQRRAVATATALILLCVGYLARHHQAEAAHAREHSGETVHAQELADHHVGGENAHLHETATHDHAGACTLLALANAPLLDSTPVVITTPASSTERVTVNATCKCGGSIAAYRFAPKTSPPSA